jgi:peroxiredoxin Q/BCP
MVDFAPAQDRGILSEQITKRIRAMSDTTISDFELPSTGDKPFRLSELAGKTVVIYFYPKDSTPGCTTEAQQFRDIYPEFVERGCEVVGVSRDSLRSHENFKARQALPFNLLSDGDEALCTQFSVIKLKSMYGKQVRGIERSTFVIDGAGRLRREWRAIKAPGHAQEVLDFVNTL